MPSSYPGQLDIFPGAPYVDGIEFLLAAYANYWISAILAIETTVGVGTGATAGNPLYSQAYGASFPTVTARIAATEAAVEEIPGLNTAAGNIKAVGITNLPGVVGSGADAGHVHQGVTSFVAGSTSGLAVQSTDGLGHGGINASVSLPTMWGSGGFAVPNGAENTGFLAYTTPTLNPGTWVLFFSGYVGVWFGTASFYTVSPGTLLFTTEGVLGNGDNNSSSADSFLPINVACVVFFTSPGSVSLWTQSTTETGYTGNVYCFGFQLSTNIIS